MKPYLELHEKYPQTWASSALKINKVKTMIFFPIFVSVEQMEKGSPKILM